MRARVCVCLYVCVRACVRSHSSPRWVSTACWPCACVRARARVCVRACACTHVCRKGRLNSACLSVCLYVLCCVLACEIAQTGVLYYGPRRFNFNFESIGMQDPGKRQALAAVGQVHLMRCFEDTLSALDLVSGLNLSACAFVKWVGQVGAKHSML